MWFRVFLWAVWGDGFGVAVVEEIVHGFELEGS